MSISCQINWKFFSVQPSVHPTIYPLLQPGRHALMQPINTSRQTGVACNYPATSSTSPLFYSLPSAPEPAVQNREILCSCWEETASIRPSCCPSQTSASPSPAPVSCPLLPPSTSSPYRADSDRPPPDTLLFFPFLSPQLTWRSAVKTRWWGWCPAGSLSAGCLSATGYWTTRSCRPSNWTMWKISVSITDHCQTGNMRWTNVTSWIHLNKRSQNQYCAESLDTKHLFGIVSQISDMNGFIFIIPFESLRPLLNKATWKCPFVWGGTISIFFSCVLCCVNLYGHLFWRNI